MACARICAIINIWNGVVVCACVLCNIKAYYIHSTYKYTLKKCRLGEVTIFENCGIVEMEKMERIYV